MRKLALLAVCSGCHFGVQSVELEMGMPLDGSAGDGNLEMPAPVDANPPDLSMEAPDLHRPVPDGAMPRQPGYPCSTANECDNGFCIDGFCCDDLCDPLDPANQCRACNVPGAEGHCVFAQDGTDPRGLCDEESTSTCGHDGLCDGRGSCRFWGAGTACGGSTCTSGQFTAPPMCDGQGHCIPSNVTADCDPYACAGDHCATSCTPSSGCAQGATCDAFGECNDKAGIGANCMMPSDCASGFCSQGVCCQSDCSGVCRSCSLPSSKGLCILVADGSDPFNDCAAQSRTTCGTDGACDGKGACRFWASTTVCRPASCSGDTSMSQRTCDGNGACQPAVATDCTPYTCNPLSGGCFSSCFVDQMCAMGDRCKKNKCGP
jgi:hypothetical protein